MALYTPFPKLLTPTSLKSMESGVASSALEQAEPCASYALAAKQVEPSMLSSSFVLDDPANPSASTRTRSGQSSVLVPV